MSNTTKIDINGIDADNKFEKYKNVDPLPEIPCALLNSADIINYVEKVALLNPFLIDEEYLKPASCSIRVEGKYIYWESNNQIVEGTLAKEGDFFMLKKNTIAFVSLESRLRLPHYIAARFNLQIKQVHRGILLGTGPLVDPGFKGDLFIPLHNLTSNDYKITFHDPLIWMEFTKISNSKDFIDNIGNERKNKFFPFKVSSASLPPEQYLAKAAPHVSIINSLSALIKEEEELISDIKKTEDNTEKISNKVEATMRTINFGLLFTFAGLLAMFVAIVNVIMPDVREIRKNYYDKVKETDNKAIKDADQIKEINKRMNENTKVIDSLKIVIEKIKSTSR